VERVVVAESAAAQRLDSAGVASDALGRTASRLFDAAPGFVPARGARPGVRRFLATVDVQGAEALAGGPSGGAVAHVVIAVELTPVDGNPALREMGRAAEPVGTEPDALRAALERAAAAALGRAVGAFSVQLAAEQKRTPELVKDLSSPEARVRDHAVRVLADRGARDAVPPLMARLRDSDPEVAERAVGALAQLRDARAVPALIELAHHRDGPYVANLAHVVGDIGGADAKAWLLTMASGHPDEVVRVAAREALTEMSIKAPHARVAQ
jgi:HEAT repeat protein